VFTVLNFIVFIINACLIVLDDIFVVSRYSKGFLHVFVICYLKFLYFIFCIVSFALL